MDAIQRRDETLSARFTNAIIKEFSVTAGSLSFGPIQKKLAQHLFIKIDAQLKTLEAKRLEKGQKDKLPIAWSNINMEKLALDAVYRIELGLDALIPNHIHPIPYLNSRLKKYDLDLRIGYQGKIFYRKELAIDPPKDIRVELVYSTDIFKPIKKSIQNQIEGYEFSITNAFNRGDVIGGFGYIIYDNQDKNRIILVSEADFQKSLAKAQDQSFWTKNPIEMRWKTLVHRIMDKLEIDPAKMTEAVAAAENDSFEEEIEANANQEAIDIVTEEPIGTKAIEAPKESIDMANTTEEVKIETGGGPDW